MNVSWDNITILEIQGKQQKKYFSRILNIMLGENFNYNDLDFPSNFYWFIILLINLIYIHLIHERFSLLTIFPVGV